MTFVIVKTLRVVISADKWVYVSSERLIMHNSNKQPLSVSYSNTQMAPVQSNGFVDKVNCASLVLNQQPKDANYNRPIDPRLQPRQQRLEYSSNTRYNDPRLEYAHQHHSGRHHDTSYEHRSSRYSREHSEIQCSRHARKQESRRSHSKSSKSQVPECGFTIQEAKAAQQLEIAYKFSHTFIIRFPDPQLNSSVVAGFHSAIENVNFPTPPVARYCAIKLKPGTDLDEFAKVINKTPFGSGMLELEIPDYIKSPGKLEEIDPCTLYVQPLLPGLDKHTIHRMFPTSMDIDIVYTPDDLHVHYAYIKYRYSSQAMFEFKEAHRTNVAPDVLIMRFRRTPYVEGPFEDIFTQCKDLSTEKSHAIAKPKSVSEGRIDDYINLIDDENEPMQCAAKSQDICNNKFNICIKAEDIKAEIGDDMMYNYKPPVEIDSDVDSLELDDVLIVN